MRNNLLEVRGLKVSFFMDGKPAQPAVKGASFTVAKGSTVVLAGESGSGKSITCRAITGIMPLTARITGGSVVYKGMPLESATEKELAGIRGKEIAYIFQEPASYLDPVYTIGAQIGETLIAHQDMDGKEAAKRTLELLGMVRLPDPARVAASYPHQLSGGMNQRCCIAMALACSPSLLIADEPTTALDATTEAQVLELLATLQDTLGFSLLFITHNLGIARAIADKVCIMFQGEIVEEGTVEDIFGNPGHRHTKDLIAAYHKIGSI